MAFTWSLVVVMVTSWLGMTSAQECIADVIVALDESSSVREENFLTQLRFTEDLVKRIGVRPGGARIGLLTFNSQATVHFYLDEYVTARDVISAVRNVPYKPGDTNPAAALQAATDDMFQPEKGDRTDALNVLVLITDGVSSDINATSMAAQHAHRAGVTVYPVGVGLVGWTHELDIMASPPANTNRYVVRDFDELLYILDKFMIQLCSGTRCPACRGTQIQ